MNHVIITEGTWSTSRDPCRNDPLDPIISIIELVAGSLVWTKLADIAPSIHNHVPPPHRII